MKFCQALGGSKHFQHLRFEKKFAKEYIYFQSKTPSFMIDIPISGSLGHKGLTSIAQQTAKSSVPSALERQSNQELEDSSVTGHSI